MTPPEADIYQIHVYPDICTDGSFCYVAEHPDLPGCVAHGDTVEVARERLDKAKAAYLEHLRETGQRPPEPKAAASLVLQESFLEGVPAEEEPVGSYQVG